MAEALNLQINRKLKGELIPIDAENGCLVIDDFLANPEEAVEYACSRRGDFFAQERAYPGEILPLGAAEADTLHGFIRSRLSRPFGFLRGDIRFQTQFSLTTLQPEEFSWIQCLPHADPRREAGRANYATVLYLFENAQLGGTGFYRWKDAEFWQRMTADQKDDPQAGLEQLRERFRMFHEPWTYTTGTNEAVELLAEVEPRFNRIICYPGDVPHNAQVTDATLLRSDPRSGRLTLNSFASVWPKA